MQVISEPYRKLNADLHASRPDYGRGGHKLAEQVQKLADAVDATSILDYGCGKGTLAKAMSVPVQNYDPAFPEYAAPPEPADLVVCTDVLEHIEPEHLNAVLFDLMRVTRKMLFLLVATKPASKTLADGRNAHLIVMPCEWWLNHLIPLFKLTHLDMQKSGFVAIMRPR